MTLEQMYINKQLSMRTYNFLVRQGIKTMEELVNISGDALSRKPNFCDKVKNEIIELKTKYWEQLQEAAKANKCKFDNIEKEWELFWQTYVKENPGADGCDYTDEREMFMMGKLGGQFKHM